MRHDPALQHQDPIVIMTTAVHADDLMCSGRVVPGDRVIPVHLRHEDGLRGV